MADNVGILCDEDGDLRISNGTFVNGNTEADEVRRIVMAVQGDYKWEPLVGVGLRQRLGMSLASPERGRLENDIRRQLRYDGLAAVTVSMDTNGNLTVDAQR
jgi:hypothetical protein